MLQASPESDALVILGRLLDSLPIGFHVSDCGGDFHVLYANRVWERWLGKDKLPVAGKGLGELFASAEGAGVLAMMREVCATSQAKHLKSFEFRELGNAGRGAGSGTSRWDWEIYPLTGPDGEVTHLLNVVMDVSEPTPRKGRISKEDRQAQNRRREEASGVLRIFGVARDAGSRDAEDFGNHLSGREYQVAELVAMGLTNAAMARELNLGASTVSTHVAHILAKLGFRSRAQVAAWVVARRLKPPPASEALATPAPS